MFELLLLIIVPFLLFLCYVSVSRARVWELLSSGRLVAVLASRGRGLAVCFMSCKDYLVGVVSGLGCGGDRPRSCARIAMPMGNGLGGVLLQRTRIGKLQTTGA